MESGRRTTMSAVYVAFAVVTIVVGARIASTMAGGFDLLAHQAPGSADFVMGTATVVATLFFVMAFVPQDRPNLRRVLPRLGSGLVANLLASMILFLALMVALLLAALGSILGVIVGLLGILWVACRLVLVPAIAMFGSKGPTSAIGRSWRMTRGMSLFIAIGLVVTVALAMAVGAFLGQFADSLAITGTVLVVAGGHAGIAAATWNAAGFFAPRPPPEAPERLVGPEMDVPDAARLMPLRDQSDVERIRALPRGAVIWALLETNDQELMAHAVQAGVQVFVADDKHRAQLGLQNADGPRLADLTDAGISWCGSLYVGGDHGWTRVITAK